MEAFHNIFTWIATIAVTLAVIIMLAALISPPTWLGKLIWKIRSWYGKHKGR